MRTFFKQLLTQLLLLEARTVLRRYKPKIVAVTGSVGKTSTKDAIFEILAHSTHVRKSEKSFNSEIGLPLTILGLPNAWNNPFRWIQNLLDGLFLVLSRAQYPEWLVLEVGADRPGDIMKVAKWLSVDVAVVTRLPEVPVHVEFFDSPQQVVEEKAALLDALKPDGVLVVYADDERGELFKERAAGKRIITFGLSEHADVRAHNPQILFEEGRQHWPLGMRADISAEGVTLPIEVVGTVGVHTLLPALAAVGVGLSQGMPIEGVAEALRHYEPPAGRMHVLPGVKESYIIDDTYNSSPAAVTAALDTLDLVAQKGSSAGRRIAVLGDMLELGRHSVEEHRKIGAYAAKTADMLITVGFRARDMAVGALDAGMKDEMILQHEDARRAGEELETLLQPGDCVLVKGSQSMRMEKTVEAIMAEPQRAKELLVRQEREWRVR